MKRINLLNSSQIAALYADVPSSELEKYRAFLRAYPYQELNFAGVDWAYIASEPNGEDLLVLSGALCAPEVSWQTIARLAEKYRVIAPEYPPVKGMDELVDGIAAMLQKEGVASANVLGGSYGGFVAQVFVRRYPEITRSLVLSHTLPPFPEGGKRVEKMMRWFSLLPEGALRWLMGKRLGSLLPEKTPETAVLYANFEEMLHNRLTKADLMALLSRTVDFTNREFIPGDLERWSGKVLLILADNDPATPEDVRARLLALYPGAELCLFQGSGHATAVARQDEYFAAVDEFLKKQ